MGKEGIIDIVVLPRTRTSRGHRLGIPFGHSQTPASTELGFRELFRGGFAPGCISPLPFEPLDSDLQYFCFHLLFFTILVRLDSWSITFVQRYGIGLRTVRGKRSNTPLFRLPVYWKLVWTGGGENGTSPGHPPQKRRRNRKEKNGMAKKWKRTKRRKG